MHKKRFIMAALQAAILSSGIVHASDITPDNPANNTIDVHENNYTLNGTNSTVTENYDFIYGGGNETNAANASDNRINIFGGNISGIFGGMAALGYNAYNNHIIINGGTITGVVGGLAVWHSGWDVGNVYNNTVEVNGGRIGYVSGGEIGYSTESDSDSDPSTASGDVHHNSVIIRSGEVTGGIVGGSALGGNAYSNKISISGGKVSGDVIGGRSMGGSTYNNTITISGNPDISGANFYGNNFILNTSNISARNIYGFDNINFNLNANYNPANPALTLTDGSTTINSLSNIAVNVDPNSNIRGGDTLNLIYNQNGISVNDSSTYDTMLSKGGLRAAPMTLSLVGGNNIRSTVGEFDLTPEAPIIPESYRPAIEVLHHSFVPEWLPPEDFSDLDDAVDNPDISLKDNTGYEVFTNFGGFRLKTKGANGSYSRTNGGNYDLGFARSLDMQSGKLIFAPVFEYGNGNYEVYLKNGTRGYGTSKYAAGGFIARKVYNSGFYFELSARGGKSDNNFTSDDFKIAGMQSRADYHSSAPIFTGHIRLGKALRLNQNNLLDVYSYYFYTRQGGTDTNIHYSNSASEHCNFSSINSSRFKLGYRLTTRTSRISRIYTGLSFQYDRNSNALTHLEDGTEIFNKGAKGSSGILEFGWQIKPNRDNPWLVDINTTGWIGHQKGFTAVAKMKKSF